MGPYLTNKQVIFTSASYYSGIYLLEWAISLRTLGHYQNEIFILDYGIDHPIKRALESLNIRFIRRVLPNGYKEKLIVNRRLLDVIPIIEEYPTDTTFVHFDADIWFQDDIQHLFQKIEHCHGCVYSTEISRNRPLRGKIKQYPTEWTIMMKKYDFLLDQFGGHINGGFMGGNALSFLNKLYQFQKLVQSGFISDQEWGSDQFAMNYLYNESTDQADAYKWNCVLSDAIAENKILYTKRKVKEKIAGVHYFHMNKDRMNREFHFYFLYPDLFNQCLKKTGLLKDLTNQVFLNTSAQEKSKAFLLIKNLLSNGLIQ